MTLLEPVEGWVRVTLAPGTAEPLESVTVPWIVPVAFVTWARVELGYSAVRAIITNAIEASTHRGRVRVNFLITSEWYAIALPFRVERLFQSKFLSFAK